MKFSRHGSFHIQVQDSIVMVESKGPYNEETSQAFSDAYYKLVAEHNLTCWVQVHVFHGLPILTPEAQEILMRLAKWRVKKGMIGSAIIGIDINVPSVSLDILKNITQQSGVPYHKVFQTVEDAKAWGVQLLNSDHDQEPHE